MAEKTLDDLLSMKEILQVAIKREEESRAFYLKVRECARTPLEEEMFTKLADQELVHKNALQQKLDEIEAQMDIDRALSYDVY